MAKLLILSVSAGNGHVRAAQALEAAAASFAPHTAVHIDAMNFVVAGLRCVQRGEAPPQQVDRARGY